MRKAIRTLALAAAACVLLAACSPKGERYSINIISEEYSSVFEHYTGMTVEELRQMALEPNEGAEEPQRRQEPEEPEQESEIPEGSERPEAGGARPEEEESDEEEDEEIPPPPREEPREETEEPSEVEEDDAVAMPLVDVGEGEKYTCDTGRHRHLYLDDRDLRLVDSVTVCDDSVTDRQIMDLVERCSKYDIPIFIMGARPSQETMDSYDKLFCIGADYRYLGEAFGELVNSCWLDSVQDRNSDQIFQFTTIRGYDSSPQQEVFYQSFVSYIELLGIPLQELDSAEVGPEQLVPYFNSMYSKTECYIILENSYMERICEEYEGDASRIAMIGIVRGVDNPFTQYPFVKVCFLDYREFFNAKRQIMNNISRTQYPLKDISYDTIGRYVYVDPVF